MVDFATLVLILVALGYELMALSFAGNGGYVSNDDAVEAMMVISFLLYTATLFLVLLSRFGDLKGNQIATIATTVCAFLAALFLLVGVALVSDRNDYLPFYSGTLYVVSMLFAIAAGILLVLQMLGIGGSSSSSSSGGSNRAGNSKTSPA